MNSQNTNKHKLGKIGEELVANILGLKESNDPFDIDGDLYDEKTGESYEVKTQVRHPTKGCFTINTKHTTNFQKCLKVDHLIFVEYNNDDMIRIWECTDRNVCDVFTTKDGRTMAGWKINKMKLLKEIEDIELSKRMRDVSSSSFIKK